MKEEEYQYPTEELTPSPTDESISAASDETETHEEPGFAPPKKPNAIMGFIKNNKKMVSIIGGIVIVLIVFHFMHSPAKPKVVYKTKSVPTAQPNALLEGQMHSLQTAEENNNASIAQVQNQMSTLNQTLNKTNTSNQELGNALIALSEELKQLKHQLATHKQVQVVKKGLPRPQLVFHLRAIIPGRAWIVSNQNLAESIRVGDAIPNYGTVEAILDGQGIVKTSSGKLIRYGKNDS